MKEDEEGARTPPSVQKQSRMQYLGWLWCHLSWWHHLQEPSDSVTLQTMTSVHIDTFTDTRENAATVACKCFLSFLCFVYLMQHLLCAAAMLMYRKRHIARYYDNPQSPAGLPLPRALVHRLKCNNNDSCHFVSGLKCVRSTANDLWYFNALRKHLIRARVREREREREDHSCNTLG